MALEEVTLLSSCRSANQPRDIEGDVSMVDVNINEFARITFIQLISTSSKPPWKHPILKDLHDNQLTHPPGAPAHFLPDVLLHLIQHADRAKCMGNISTEIQRYHYHPYAY